MALHQPLMDMLRCLDQDESTDDIRHQVELILTAEPQLARERWTNGGTWLHAAASYHLPEVVQLLLKSGADPNARTENGESPLSSVFGEREESDRTVQTVNLLLTAGADPNARMSDERTLLYRAVQTSFEQSAQLLEKAGARVDLKTAVLRGELDVVAAILRESDSPLEINSITLLAQDVLDMPLYAATGDANQIAIMQLLLDHGFQLTTPAAFRAPILVAAVSSYASKDLIALLLRCGAEPNAVWDSTGETALDIALAASRIDIATLLESAGAKRARELKR